MRIRRYASWIYGPCVAAQLLFTPLAYAAQPFDPRYMPLGATTLPPIAFTEFCLQKPARCVGTDEVRTIPINAHRSELERVHREVNRTINPRIEAESVGPTWSDEGVSGGCEAYALTKRSRLLDLGYPSGALLLAVGIVPSGAAHLVLVVVSDQGDYVLDNLRATVSLWNKLPYRWVMRSTPKNPKFWQAILPPDAAQGSEW